MFVDCVEECMDVNEHFMNWTLLCKIPLCVESSRCGFMYTVL